MNQLFAGAAAVAFLYQLVIPFEEMAAYRLGLIDGSGNLVRSPRTQQERDAYDHLTRIAIKLKKLIAKVPGGNSELARLYAGIWLWREELEHEDRSILDETLESLPSKAVRPARLDDQKISPITLYLQGRRNEMSRSRELVNEFVDRILSGESGERVNETVQEMLSQRARERIIGKEYMMTESEFLDLDHSDLLGEGHVNWLPSIHRTLLNSGFTHVQTSPSRIHIYHNTDSDHPLAGARAVASYKGYKLFHGGKILQGSRQTTLEKHLNQFSQRHSETDRLNSAG